MPTVREILRENPDRISDADAAGLRADPTSWTFDLEPPAPPELWELRPLFSDNNILNFVIFWLSQYPEVNSYAVRRRERKVGLSPKKMPAKMRYSWMKRVFEGPAAGRLKFIQFLVAFLLFSPQKTDSQLLNYTQFLASGSPESVAQSQALVAATQASKHVFYFQTINLS